MYFAVTPVLGVPVSGRTYITTSISNSSQRWVSDYAPGDVNVKLGSPQSYIILYSAQRRLNNMSHTVSLAWSDRSGQANSTKYRTVPREFRQNISAIFLSCCIA